MTTSPPTNQPPIEPPHPKRHSAFIALGWGFACAACAGWAWLSGFLLVDYRFPLPNAETAVRHDTPYVIAIAGGIGGLLGGLLVALPYAAWDKSPRPLVLGGAATGVIGGALTLPAVVLCGAWLSPLVSSTLFWCLVGFLAGLIAQHLSVATAQKSEVIEVGEQMPSWIFVRLLPLLAVVTFLLWVFLVQRSIRY